MTNTTEMAAVCQVANQYLRIPTLETRHSDRLDFHDCAVWSIRDALIAAYRAGQACARGEL